MLMSSIESSAGSRAQQVQPPFANQTFLLTLAAVSTVR